MGISLLSVSDSCLLKMGRVRNPSGLNSTLLHQILQFVSNSFKLSPFRLKLIKPLAKAFRHSCSAQVRHVRKVFCLELSEQLWIVVALVPGVLVS
jgi:hypothetical protein